MRKKIGAQEEKDEEKCNSSKLLFPVKHKPYKFSLVKNLCSETIYIL